MESKLKLAPERAAHRSGWQVDFFRSLFRWHEPDPDLLWRFKAGLTNQLFRTNADHLLGAEIPKKKSARSFRILLLGDSSPVGLGLKIRWQAFGERARELLEMQYGERRDFELINAAVSGYTSEQIARFLRLKGWQYQPDVVVLYCGNNDASISGTVTDRRLLETQRFLAARRMLAQLAFYRILSGILKPGEAFESGAGESLKVRVSAEEFGQNLVEIARQCQKHRRPLIVLKPPVPYLWPAGLQFKVFTHLGGETGEFLMPEAMIKILGRKLKYCLSQSVLTQSPDRLDPFTQRVYSAAFSDSMPPAAAVTYYRKLIAEGRDDPVQFNNLGVSFWELHQYEQADSCLRLARDLFNRLYGKSSSPAVAAAGAPLLFNLGINLLSDRKENLTEFADTTGLAFAYLDSALQADFFSLRIKKEYGRKLDLLTSFENVTVLDLPELFRKSGGEKLFIDHCHPTEEGHRLIAEEVFKVIQTHLPVAERKQSRKSAGSQGGLIINRYYN
ncbi:MAG: SGNH/GDSL hydrolase family protein [candidate division Zixibacteria bacterium]|nr:SGNH/GDSL hydrolase family protein [candidate division Zixibacteria bacterium]